MAQNTAMQILFDELEKLGENYSESFKEFHLSNERKNIEDSFKDPYKKGRVHPGNNMNKDFDKYFTETFARKKKVLISEDIPEFQESIDSMNQESKDRVDKMAEEIHNQPQNK